MTQSPAGSDTPRWRWVVHRFRTGSAAAMNAASASRSRHLRRRATAAYRPHSSHAPKKIRTSHCACCGSAAGNSRLAQKNAATATHRPAMLPAFRASTSRSANDSRPAAFWRRLAIHSARPVPTMAVPARLTRKYSQRSTGSANRPRCSPTMVPAVAATALSLASWLRSCPVTPSKVMVGAMRP
ncbi:Uncharacterised protein [Bordetella pertussis]|nr:Uncharacterised protein [Bordetella pertussis]